MNYFYNLILIGIFFICLLFIPAASALENTGGATALFTLQGEPTYMTLDGERLFLLQDSKYLDYSERGIYLYDISKESMSCIRKIPPPSDRGTWSFNTPAISGDIVVYEEGNHLVMTNVSSGLTESLTNLDDEIIAVSELKQSQNPWIDGDRIVWTEHENGFCFSDSGGRIVLYNLTKGEKEYIPADMPGNQSYPRISGDNIVWKDYRYGGKDDPDLYLFNLKTGLEIQLPAENKIRGLPVIFDDHVLWSEIINGVHEIVHYSLSSKARTIIGPGSVGHGHVPTLSGDYIVWLQPENPLDHRNNDNAVMVMNLVSGEKIQLTDFKKGLSFPAISGERIIYTSGEGEEMFKESRNFMLYTLKLDTKEETVNIDTETDYEKENPGKNTPTTSLPYITAAVGIIAGAIVFRRLQ